jgi:hypothetical protein
MVWALAWHQMHEGQGEGELRAATELQVTHVPARGLHALGDLKQRMPTKMEGDAEQRGAGDEECVFVGERLGDGGYLKQCPLGAVCEKQNLDLPCGWLPRLLQHTPVPAKHKCTRDKSEPNTGQRGCVTLARPEVGARWVKGTQRFCIPSTCVCHPPTCTRETLAGPAPNQVGTKRQWTSVQGARKAH